MTYLSQNQIKEFREGNKPISCPILDIKTDDWVLDHDHQNGMVRGVISRQANSLLGKVEKTEIINNIDTMRGTGVSLSTSVQQCGIHKSTYFLWKRTFKLPAYQPLK